MLPVSIQQKLVQYWHDKNADWLAGQEMLCVFPMHAPFCMCCLRLPAHRWLFIFCSFGYLTSRNDADLAYLCVWWLCLSHPSLFIVFRDNIMQTTGKHTHSLSHSLSYAHAASDAETSLSLSLSSCHSILHILWIVTTGVRDDLHPSPHTTLVPACCTLCLA